jgi:chromosome segregation protein
MKVKRLEMIGFKSFVDRTVVTFDHDIIAIVGPNGCGKSNIVDAIRWCMGEQSAKHLRGRSMEDVIFSGSESRPGHDFAEVTLTFDNDSGGADLPVEYKDYPELAVTRRLHRSGESEYLINKTPVRLKDVTDLFLGTGAGTKAYSIVEQGKIGLIVSAKPEDRRMLIEEAAGITKYKSRKKQAERKMELTEQNLLRVGDIVAEIERTIGSLKRQAAKAERYLAYRSELEDLQLYDASQRYLECVAWMKLESSLVEQLALESDGARASLAGHEAELEAVRQDAHVAEEALEQAHNVHFAAENDVRAQESAIDRAKDKLASLNRRAEQAASEEHEIAEQRLRLETERTAIEDIVAALTEKETVQGEQVERVEAQLLELGTAHDEAHARAAELRQIIARSQADIASAEATLSGFERRHAEMQLRHARLLEESKDLVVLIDEHEGKRAALEQTMVDLRNGKVLTVEEQQRMEAELAGLRTKIGDSDRTLDEAKGELSKKRSRMHALLEVQARLDGMSSGVKSLLASGDPTVCGLLVDRLEAPPELVPALAGLLGPRLQDVVVRDMDRGLDLLTDLALQHAGRATIVPLHPRYVAGKCSPPAGALASPLATDLSYAAEDDALVRALVGDALVVHDVATALRLREDGVTSTLVTLDGTVLHDDGRISGGTGEELAAGMLESKREARELAAEVDDLDRRVSDLVEQHQKLRGAIVAAQGALEGARRRAHNDELAIVTTERDLRGIEGQLGNLARRAQSVQAELDELGAAMAEGTQECETARHTLDEARVALEGSLSNLDAADALAASWRSKVEERRHELTEQKIDLAGTREKLAAARGTVERLSRTTQDLSERARRLDEELVGNAVSFGQTAAELVAYREGLGSALDRARERGQELADARGAFDALRTNLSSREAAIKELRGRADEARDTLGRHEIALREQEIAMQHLLEGVADKFRGLHLPRVVGDYHMRPPPDDETRARTAQLVQLIDRMGSVNLDAVREHAEAEGRYTFYVTQKADLDKALADLQRAISQMNRESRRLFAETFEAVNQRFQEVFPRMFRGGRAALRLTNPDDLLESGIDILAQPPGKKLSNIELMSGGEKALTATSLIFAIFQIKPSPFCILDEVDAPLDEANVTRYNDMIRSMTDRSQFILITHVKRTMQVVDVLYGVTMQELGVSRVVSVKLNDAASAQRPAPQAVAVA